MSSFLNQLAETLIQNHQESEFRKITIVTPSRRAGTHLKKELSLIKKKTIWSPKIVTLDQFFKNIYDKEIIDQTHALVSLYRSYNSTIENPEEFKYFLNWGEQILSDFNEINRYLLDQKEVFKNLMDIKDIEAWSFNSEEKELSNLQSNFLTFWENLGDIYTSFHDSLKKQNLATTSWMYREIAESPEVYLKKITTPVYLIGFNALSAAEETIFKQLKSLNKAKVFWDIDEYYVNNTELEAGYFFRKNIWDESIKTASNNIAKNKAEVSIYPSKNNINQLRIAGNILENNPHYFSTKTALILADENLLQPLLYSLPESSNGINITMGFPIKQTSAGDLIKTLLKIIQNNKRQSLNNIIYHKEFFKLIDNTLIGHFLLSNQIKKKKIQNKVSKNNLAYLSLAFIKNETNNLLPQFETLLSTNKNAIEIFNAILDLIESLRVFLVKENKFKEETEALYLSQKIIVKLISQTKKYPEFNSFEVLEKLLLKNLSSEKLSFFGEPLQGLQIMGLLETRTIDFENIIMVSCNEKFLPGNKQPNSIIPHDLRAYLGLPNKFEKEAIFSYYFYRLLHHAKNVHFIYNNGLPDKLNSNEISRYLLQLKHEYPYSIQTIDENFEFNSIETTKEIPKKDIIQKTDLFFRSGMSPSSLNTYLNCSKDFYFKYLLRIQEEDNVEEAIESSTKGDIVHEVLETLYIEAANNSFPYQLSTEDVEQMLLKYKTLIEKGFSEKFQKSTFKQGKNYLLYKMSLKSIEHFLKNEIEFIKKNGPITIHGVEIDFSTLLKVKTQHGEKEVKLKGKFDRIDEVNGIVRVIDYKSGHVKPEDVKISISRTTKEPSLEKNQKALQLLFYKYLYWKNTNVKPSAGIFSLINLKEGLIEYNQSKIEDDLNLFEKFIIEKIKEVYNSEQNFIHNPEAKYCLLCEN